MTDNVVRHEGAQRAEEPSSRALLHKRAMANGFGNAMGTATELALLPGLFGALGWFIDNQLDTGPIFLIALLSFAFAGMLVRAWLGYDKEMRKQEAYIANRLHRGHDGGTA